MICCKKSEDSRTEYANTKGNHGDGRYRIQVVAEAILRTDWYDHPLEWSFGPSVKRKSERKNPIVRDYNEMKNWHDRD